MPREASLLVALATIVAALALAPAPAAAATCGPLHPAPAGATGLTFEPARPGDTLVVILKGTQHVASDYVPLGGMIADHGGYAIAMDYVDFDADYAAAATGAAAWTLLAANPSIDRVVAFGVSGGFPATTLLLVDGWTKPDCSPLVDVVFDVEGVSNLVETYAEARAAFAAVPAAGEAVGEIEAECGSPADAACLAARSLALAFADEDVDLDGAAVFQAVNDGLVPVNQGVEAAAALGAHAPADLTIFLRNAPGQGDDTDTQASEYATGPAGLPDLPLAGHASEHDPNHVLVREAWAKLLALLDGDYSPSGAVHVLDGEAGTLA